MSDKESDGVELVYVEEKMEPPRRKLHPTASMLHRFIKCPASAVLTQIRWTSQFAQKGRLIHKFLQVSATLGREAGLKAIEDVEPEILWICEEIDLELLGTMEMGAEASYAIDLATGGARFIGYDLNRNYGELTDTEIVGTADVVGVRDDIVYIGDYKTGRGWVAPAKWNAQLSMLALAACRVHDVERAHVEIIRIDEDGGHHKDTAEKTIGELEEFEAILFNAFRKGQTALHEYEQGRVPDLNEGPWCTYCPAEKTCPAKLALVRSLMFGDELERMTRELKHGDLGGLYRRWQEINRWMWKIQKEIYARAGEDPIDLGKGEWLRMGQSKGREELDGDIVFEIMTEKYPLEVATKAVKCTATKTGVKAAIRSIGGKIGAESEAIFEETRNRGGASKKSTKKVAIFRTPSDG